MLDRFNRKIDYLRISVTDRCNLRCEYCMPPEGIKLKSHNDILSYEEIVNFTKTAVKTGINKVRITGGEPLVRKGIAGLIKELSLLEGLLDICMTTNGILLSEYSTELKAAGLHRINISLDTLNKVKYYKITRGGDLDAVIEGIKSAVSSGFKKIKINTVIDDKSSQNEIAEIKKFAADYGIESRLIRRMDLEKGLFGTVENGTGGDCRNCNRIRLTADGFVRPCLFSDLKFSIKEYSGEEAIKKAVMSKPEKGGKCTLGGFYLIGG
jgi:GTP 3',8-cyclase